MSTSFKSRFSNRMEHVTKSGQTQSQSKSNTHATTTVLQVRSQNAAASVADESPTRDAYPPHSQPMASPTSMQMHSHSNRSSMAHRSPSNMSNMVATNFFQSPSSNHVHTQQHSFSIQQQQQQPQYYPSHMQQPQHQPLAPPPQFEESSPYDQQSNNKLTAQQFQSYLHDFSPMRRQTPTQAPNSLPTYASQTYPPPPQHFTHNHAFTEMNDFFQANDAYDFETHSTSAVLQKQQKTSTTKRPTAYSARSRCAIANRSKPNKRQNKQSEHERRSSAKSVSLEYSRKPRKIQFRPYTLNEFQLLAPIDTDNARLGPDLEDDALQSKMQQYLKVRDYADCVLSKNKQHRPKQKQDSTAAKSKTQLANEYANVVNKMNKAKLRRSPSNEIHVSEQYGSTTTSEVDMLRELQQLHIRNSAIAKNILYE